MKHRPAREEELLNDSDAYKALLREELRLLQSLARRDRSIAEDQQREDLMGLSVYELARLRKIEKTARGVATNCYGYLADPFPCEGGTLKIDIRFIEALRKALETETDVY